MVLLMQPLSMKKKETAFFAEGSAHRIERMKRVKDKKSKIRPAVMRQI